jgi:hypothetical protein
MLTSSPPNAERSAETLEAAYPKDFGIFYPTGCLVAGFPTEKHAIDIQTEFVAGGYGLDDCALFNARAILMAADHDLKLHDGFLARLGWSAKAVQKHLDLARENGAMLVIRAKADDETERAMTIIRRAPFVFVHRYHTLAIEELS